LRTTNAPTIFVMLAINADLHQVESALVGLCTESARVVAAAKAIAAKPERRALLVPLALVLLGRDEALADEVKQFLPKTMADKLADALSGKTKLSQAELNGLGDVRTVETVRFQLAKLFSKDGSTSDEP
jgi:hypothetical protein